MALKGWNGYMLIIFWPGRLQLQLFLFALFHGSDNIPSSFPDLHSPAGNGTAAKYAGPIIKIKHIRQKK